MSLLNPFTWLARKPAGDATSGDDPRFSRPAFSPMGIAMDNRITFRCDDDFKRLLDRRAHSFGMTTSEYVRMRLMKLEYGDDYVRSLFSSYADMGAGMSDETGRGRE